MTYDLSIIYQNSGACLSYLILHARPIMTSNWINSEGVMPVNTLWIMSVICLCYRAQNAVSLESYTTPLYYYILIQKETKRAVPPTCVYAFNFTPVPQNPKIYLT